jgi:hypothetical protein
MLLGPAVYIRKRNEKNGLDVRVKCYDRIARRGTSSAEHSVGVLGVRSQPSAIN